jgi:hypothetical protein
VSTNNAIIIFESTDHPVQVRLAGETIWLTQRQMAEVFATTPENVLMHLKNIYAEGELQEAATTKEFLVVQTEGKRQVQRRLKHYNLDAIISVGYRVSSTRATRFRQWATHVLREHLARGFSLDRERFERNAAEADAALALALLVAESDAKNKNVMIGLIENMLAQPASGGA